LLFVDVLALSGARTITPIDLGANRALDSTQRLAVEQRSQRLMKLELLIL